MGIAILIAAGLAAVFLLSRGGRPPGPPILPAPSVAPSTGYTTQTPSGRGAF